MFVYQILLCVRVENLYKASMNACLYRGKRGSLRAEFLGLPQFFFRKLCFSKDGYPFIKRI